MEYDGRIRIERLTPGRWDVEAFETEPDKSFSSSLRAPEGSFRFPWDCEVFEGETTVHDLDLGRRTSCTIRGSMHIDGAPAAGWGVRLRLRYHRGRPSDRTVGVVAADGTFELELREEGLASLGFYSAHESDRVRLNAEVELVEGLTEWSAALDTGRLEVTNVPHTKEWNEVPHLLWEGANGLHVLQRLVPDALGASVLFGVPAGEVRIVRFPVTKGGWSHRTAHEVLATARVPAGGTARIALP